MAGQLALGVIPGTGWSACDVQTVAQEVVISSPCDPSRADPGYTSLFS